MSDYLGNAGSAANGRAVPSHLGSKQQQDLLAVTSRWLRPSSVLTKAKTVINTTTDCPVEATSGFESEIWPIFDPRSAQCVPNTASITCGRAASQAGDDCPEFELCFGFLIKLKNFCNLDPLK